VVDSPLTTALAARPGHLALAWGSTTLTFRDLGAAADRLASAIAARPGERVVIPYGEPSNVLYAWDAQAGGYRRFVNGVAQVDANTGHQIVAANVVVHFAVQTVTDIIEDVEGSRSLKFGLVGSGRALLFRDGRRIDLTWTRQRSDQVTRYEFGGGAVATFAPGSVWIALVADTLQVG